MSEPYIQAAFYLSPSLDQWWRWEDNAQVLAWDDGRTIAFTAEVTSVICRLAPGGLPPFAAIALLLAACHDDWESSDGRGTIVRWCDGLSAPSRAPRRQPTHVSGGALQVAGDRVATEMKSLMDGLDAISRLPKPLRGPVAAKALLAEVVFETSRNRGGAEQGQQIASAMANGLSASSLRPQLAAAYDTATFTKQASEMAAGLARVDAEALSRRLGTGLEELVAPPEKELSPPEKVRQLLAELRGDEELSALAKLAHDLMAAVAVPRALRLREDLQMGGVFDLTNRGPLDRLLVSELAQDDLTLAVRVAVNEAMYLRRESPPKEPPHHRAILLDAGVRMWGVPRVFATAVALALSAMADPAAALHVYRAADADAVPVDLTTRQGLVAHLAALESPAHPGAALPAFIDAAAAAIDGTVDAFVLTQADAARDAGFLAAVAALGLPSIYLGAVDRDGSFSLVARTRGGEKPVRQAKLSLEEILTRRPKQPPVATPLIDESDRRDDMPAIFFADPFPLLLPHVADPMRSMTSKQHGLVTVTDDGRLLHWTDDKRGARQLMHDMPRGQLRMLKIDHDLRQLYALVVRGREETARLVVSSFDGHARVIPIALRQPAPSAAFQRGAFVFVVSDGRVDAYAITSGARVASIDLPAGARHHRGRFFQIGSCFAVVAFDGTRTLKLENLPTQVQPGAVFDREGHEGFWFIAQGKVADQSLSKVYPLPSHLSPQQLWDVSPDGHLLHFHSASAIYGKAYLVDLQMQGQVIESRTMHWSSQRLGRRINFSLASPVQLRKKFTSIGLNGRNELVLSHRGRNASRALVARGADLALEAIPGDTSLLAVRDFEPFATQATRLKLRIVRWPDGSRAWLDSRGLLHLRSGDRSVPELSVVLRDDRHPLADCVAAWSSEGHVIGPKFFVGDASQVTASYFLGVVRRFAERLRP